VHQSKLDDGLLLSTFARRKLRKRKNINFQRLGIHSLGVVLSISKQTHPQRIKVKVICIRLGKDGVKLDAPLCITLGLV